MSTFALASLGGLISLLSASLDSALSLFSSGSGRSFRWSLSIDFALGLMVSASAFSLIGPAASGATQFATGFLCLPLLQLVSF